MPGGDGLVLGVSGLSLGADGLEPHRFRAQAHLAELLADLRGCPAGLGLVAVARRRYRSKM